MSEGKCDSGLRSGHSLKQRITVTHLNSQQGGVFGEVLNHLPLPGFWRLSETCGEDLERFDSWRESQCSGSMYVSEIK